MPISYILTPKLINLRPVDASCTLTGTVAYLIDTLARVLSTWGYALLRHVFQQVRHNLNEISRPWAGLLLRHAWSGAGHRDSTASGLYLECSGWGCNGTAGSSLPPLPSLRSTPLKFS